MDRYVSSWWSVWLSFQNTALDKETIQLTTYRCPGPQTVTCSRLSAGMKGLPPPVSPTTSGPAFPTKQVSCNDAPTETVPLETPTNAGTDVPDDTSTSSPPCCPPLHLPPSAPVSLLPSPSVESFPVSPAEIRTSPPPAAPCLPSQAPPGPPELLTCTSPSTPVSCPPPSSPTQQAASQSFSPVEPASPLKPVVFFPLASPTQQEPSSPPSIHPTLFPSPPSTPPTCTTPPSPCTAPAEDFMETV